MSLAERISQLTNPIPTFIDPEDNLDTETAAKVVDYTSENEDISVESSNLRLRNVPLLSESSTRYAGKKTSRKELEESISAEVTSDDDSTEHYNEDSKSAGSPEEEVSDNSFKDDEEVSDNSFEDDEEVSDNSFEDDEEVSNNSFEDEEDSRQQIDKYSDDEDDSLLQSFKNKLGRQVKFSISPEDEQTVDDQEHDMISEQTSQDEESKTFKNENCSLEEQPLEFTDSVKTFSDVRSNKEVDKGVAVKAQLSLWDSLLQCRIKLQKILLSANQLPQFDVWPEFVLNGGTEFIKRAAKSQISLQRFLDKLLELQTLLFMKNSETKYILNLENEESNEEIPSDTSNDAEHASKSVASSNFKRKLAVDEYPEFLKKRCAHFERYRNATIQTWNDKTLVVSGKLKSSFAGFEQSALKQIEQIMCDQDRLIRRTQLKRATYQLLGKQYSFQNEDKAGEKDSGPEAVFKQDFHLKDVDAEIFDDNDFYHQLLRELIERKTTDLEDPLTFGRRWLEIQQMRSKLKKKSTTRQNIRYDVHNKLVNFMAPVENVTIVEDSRKDLFSTIFGSAK